MNLTKHWAATLDDYVIDLAWSPTGTHLAAASAGGPISILAAADGSRQHELSGHENGTNCLAWQSLSVAAASSPSILATGGQDGAVKLWDAVAGQHTATVSLGKAWVEQLGWRPPGSNTALETKPESYVFAVAGKDSRAIRADGSVAHPFKPTPKTISALSWQPRGGCVAVAYF
ncbi:MAG: WD40 repeat domain-containing protein, partial [Opitutaceae bacterium]